MSAETPLGEEAPTLQPQPWELGVTGGGPRGVTGLPSSAAGLPETMKLAQ